MKRAMTDLAGLDIMLRDELIGRTSLRLNMSRPGLTSISASTTESGISNALRRRASLLPDADTSSETLPLSAVKAERIEFLSLYLTVRKAISSTACFVSLIVRCQIY